MVIAIGALSSAYLAKKRILPKPVIATTIIDPVMQGLPYNEQKGISNRHNLNYFTPYGAVDEDIETIEELFHPRKVAVLIDGKLLKNDMKIGKYLLQKFKKKIPEALIVGVGNDIDKIVQVLPEDVDLVYVTPMFEMDEKGKRRLFNALKAKKMKSFSVTGYTDVQLGALLANNAPTDMKKFIRQIALNVQQIALGAEAGLQEVNFVTNQSIYLNMDTASKIGFKPSWELISRATVVAGEKAGLDAISLENIMDKAVLANLDAKSAKLAVKQSEAELKKAKGYYLPQLNIGFEAVQVDQDRATASLGLLNETRADAYLAFSQQLYNQKVFSQVSINRHFLRSRQYSDDFIKLEAALHAAQQYIDILKLENTLKIQKKNLELTKENLKAANVRLQIGVGNVKDIYRWESKLANDKKVLLQTLVSIKQAKNTLLTLLDMPHSSDIKISEVELRDPVLLTHHQEINDYFIDQEKFERFKKYLLMLSDMNMPSLSQYREIVKVKEEVLKLHKKAMYLPDVSVEGVLRQHFITSSNSVRDDDPNLKNYPYADNTDWDIGVFVRFPLYQGGAKKAQIEAASNDLLQAYAKKKKLANDIHNNLLNALYQSRALFLSIKLAREALENSQKNLAVTRDIYNQGNSSIIYLLDAQSDTLRAALQLNRIKYDFMKYLLAVQYYIGQVNFHLDEATWKEWYTMLIEYKGDEQ